MDGTPREVLEKLLTKYKKMSGDFVETILPDEEDDIDLITEEEESEEDAAE